MRFAVFIFSAALFAQNPSTFDSIVRNADAARDVGKMDQAVTLYQQALHLRPDWKQGWWVLGSILYDSNRYQDGEKAFLPLTVLDPDKSAGWAMAGLCEFEIKHYEDSLNNLQKATRLGLPQSLDDVVNYHIELILIRTGQFEAALKVLSRYALQGGDNPKIVEAMGLAALRKPMLPADIPPADHDLIMAVGQAVRDAAANRTKDSISQFRTLLATYPNLPQLHYLDGMVLLETDPDQALAEFKQELNLSPNHPQALISLASEYVKRDDYKAALPYAEKAVDSDSRFFATHAMLGKVLVQGDLDVPRGLKELETAVKMEPANPQSRLALASAYAKVGRKTDAANQRAEFLRLRKQIEASDAGPGAH
jgi:tetratricopeptide (TPR) repeat protein